MMVARLYNRFWRWLRTPCAVWLLIHCGQPLLADESNSGQKHWSFQPIVRPQLPRIKDQGWTKNPIDAFVFRRLSKEGLRPSPQANRTTLMRRVTLDLTGLPPTPNEVAAFLADKSPNSYERLVDRLLASPHYGERWARPWLDVAHYADSDGYLTDQLRPVAWRFRQWVVDALNRDKRFDAFTLEQLAGDLLPKATINQRIATGFLRQTLSNREGGANVEEFRVMQVKDRVQTVATTWLGLTAGCAACHDHKYDPITQREFYQLYAFFDSADEVNVDAPLPGELKPYEASKPKYDRARRKLMAPRAAEIAKLQRRWELRLLEANANPGRDYRWDRHWEILGLIWGGGKGEGQLEGQEIVKLDPSKRTARDQQRIFEYFLRFGSPIDSKRFSELGLSQIKSQIDSLNRSLPKLSRAATMREARNPRKVHLQVDGVYNNLGDPVRAATPAVLPALQKRQGLSRFDFARWLLSSSNPLTTRVTVNRIWQEFFGRGLVRTSDDFGIRGDRPSHPQLLDWLATELVVGNWSVKRLHRTIVTSATYRQSSRETTKLRRLDPDNVLLARQSSLRLPAEAVRDSTLAVSGLLVRRIGGPSVRPPQSASVVMGGFGNSGWKAARGEGRYRRALYTFIKRATPFPQLVTFDAPNARHSCTRRERSNTPLQALTLLNDPLFFGAAEALAKRILREPNGNLKERLNRLFQLCMARQPTARERIALSNSYRELHGILQKDTNKDAELGAWTGVCSVLLNLHEFITRD